MSVTTVVEAPAAPTVKPKKMRLDVAKRTIESSMPDYRKFIQWLLSHEVLLRQVCVRRLNGALKGSTATAYWNNQFAGFERFRDNGMRPQDLIEIASRLLQMRDYAVEAGIDPDLLPNATNLAALDRCREASNTFGALGGLGDQVTTHHGPKEQWTAAPIAAHCSTPPINPKTQAYLSIAPQMCICADESKRTKANNRLLVSITDLGLVKPYFDNVKHHKI